MNITDAIILGVIEGVTEFLPVSSTGHLILTSKLLGIPATSFVTSFEISIQLGAITAVTVLFGKKLLKDFRMVKKIAVAFLPAAVLGFLFYPFIKGTLLQSVSTVLWALALGGAALIAFEWGKRWDNLQTQNLQDISYRQSFLIGLAQSLAMIPGVSRAAATIMGGMLLGVDRRTIVEFSFLLAIPTMATATGYDLLQNAATFTAQNWNILAVGFTTSAIAAFIAARFFLHFIERHTFIPFGIYRILLAVLLWIVLF